MKAPFVILILLALSALVGCSTSPSYTVASTSPTAGIGGGTTGIILGPSAGTGVTTVPTRTGVSVGTGSVATDIATAIILGQTIPRYPETDGQAQPAVPESNTRIIREGPENVEHKHMDALNGTVIDSHKYAIDSQRKRKNRAETDYSNDTGILEDNSEIWDTTTDREIQGVLVKLDDGTEINATNGVFTDLEAGDRVVVRVYETSRINRKKYRVIRKLDFRQFSANIR